MATVIDRLLVQGGSAPGCPFDRGQHSRRSDRILAPRNSPKQGFNRDVSRQQYPSTPIAKRMEFFSKIREANIGLSSMDSPNIRPGDDTVKKVNFVLNGKGVTSQNGSIRKPSTAIPKPFRAGSYKTTPRDLYRVSHGISLKTGTEHSPFGHGIHAVIEHDNYSPDGQRIVKSSSNPRDVLNDASSTSLSTTVPPPSTAPSSAMKTSDSLRSATLTSFELTGQKYAGYQSDNFYFYDSTILDDSCFPYLRSPRKRTRLPRSSFADDSFSDVARSHELQDCLKIKKSFLPAAQKNVSQPCRLGEGVTNAMRKFETENVNKDLRRYEFSNVNSYLSFNRFNTNSNPKQRIAHIPRGVVSLPAPWAESVLLKLMGDLQNPRSRLSSAKYSEIGAHEGSDEFFVIGSPTSLEKHGRLLRGQRSQGKRDLDSRSAASVKAAERIDEGEEDVLETGGTTARAPTARSEISSVDMGDIENRKMQLDSRLEENTDRKEGDLSKDPVSRQCSTSAPGDINEESRLGSEETFEQKEILRVVVKNENINIEDAIADNGETIAIKHDSGL